VVPNLQRTLTATESLPSRTPKYVHYFVFKYILTALYIFFCMCYFFFINLCYLSYYSIIFTYFCFLSFSHFVIYCSKFELVSFLFIVLLLFFLLCHLYTLLEYLITNKIICIIFLSCSAPYTDHAGIHQLA
jgi:hypothetical protein